MYFNAELEKYKYHKCHNHELLQSECSQPSLRLRNRMYYHPEVPFYACFIINPFF